MRVIAETAEKSEKTEGASILHGLAENGDLNTRLARLAETLDRFRVRSGETVGDARSGSALDRIPDERLRNLSALLRDRLDDPQIDVDDVLLLNLVLDDISAAVGHLRGMINEIDERLNSGDRVLREGRRAAALERARTEFADPADEQ